MLKTIILILFFYSINGISQTEKALVSMPDMGRLYAGYSVVIQVSFLRKKVKGYSLECIGCDTIRKIDSHSNRWMVKPDLVSEVKVLIKNRKGKIIGQRKYKVFSPPLPVLFLDKIPGNSTVKALPESLYLRHREDVPLQAVFLSINWAIEVNGKLFRGSRGEISQEVKDYIAKTKKGIMIVTVKYYGPEKGIKDLKEIFEYHLD
ncbi:MAG: hypothetical protein AB8B72_00835 [Crocinitomicaceae bacterium]